MCSNYQVITLLSLPRNASARVLKRSLKLGSIGGFTGDRVSSLWAWKRLMTCGVILTKYGTQVH